MEVCMAVTPVLHWYQVVITAGMIGPELRARVQAKNPDAALCQVMQFQRFRCATVSAAIWRLGDRGRVGVPVRRQNVRVLRHMEVN
jgi:hypothetical protein